MSDPSQRTGRTCAGFLQGAGTGSRFLPSLTSQPHRRRKRKDTDLSGPYETAESLDKTLVPLSLNFPSHKTETDRPVVAQGPLCS